MLQVADFWIFNILIVFLLVFDLVVFHRKTHEIRFKEALYLTVSWISIALIFNVYIYYTRGMGDAINFLSGYLIEKSLSVDNLFVFLVIFSALHVPKHLIHKVLFWGILGAIVLRYVFIIGGIALLQAFHWVIYLFGAFLILTGVKLFFKKDQGVKPNLYYLRRWMPLTQDFVGDNFFVRHGSKLLATPLFLALVAIEFTDVIFALDSIPAVIGITQDPYIVYTSNILAILGLRSLYFVLSHSVELFKGLHYGLAFILVFIGVKMLISDLYEISSEVSLAVVFSALVTSALIPAKE